MGSLKKVEPFLARAEELKNTEPVVSYYIRLYSLLTLMKAKEAGEAFSPEATTKLTDLFGALEASKKAVDLSQGQETMESYALRCFDKVDGQDRAGTRDATTKKLYYVAGQMLDVCKQFHDNELPPDLAEKATFAKFRCMEIHQALQQGIQPPPPPEAAAPDGAPSAEEAALLASLSQQLLPSSAPPMQPTAPMAAQAFAAPAAAAYPAAAPCAVGPMTAGARAEAQKKAEFAASALDFGDTAGGRRFLLEALQLLGGVR